MSGLPAPVGTPYRIGIVCLGNICRSPMAAVVLASLIDRARMARLVEVTSCGTGGWHTGEPMDRRAAATLLAAGYDPSAHRAQRLDHSWSDRDLLLAMDADNLAGIRAVAPPHDPGRLRMYRALDPLAGDDLDVPDPWTGAEDGFQDVLTVVERTSRALLEALQLRLRNSDR